MGPPSRARKLTRRIRRYTGGSGAAAAAKPTRGPFRFHVLAVPHTITRKDYSSCAFTENVLKFCKMMFSRGHTVYHYGHADSTVDATEHIPVMTNEDLKRAYGEYNWKKEMLKHNVNDEANRTFNTRAIEAIKSRKQPGDFLLLFWGIGHAPVAAAHPDLVAVEPGIGCFNRPCTEFSVYVSYSLMNYIYGKENWEPRWRDAVIPNYFDLAASTPRLRPAAGGAKP